MAARRSPASIEASSLSLRLVVVYPVIFRRGVVASGSWAGVVTRSPLIPRFFEYAPKKPGLYRGIKPLTTPRGRLSRDLQSTAKEVLF